MRHFTIRIGFAALLIGVAVVSRSFAATDDFFGSALSPRWEQRNIGGVNAISVSEGWLTVVVGADQHIWRSNETTTAPLFLLDPPQNDRRFSIETVVRAEEPAGGNFGRMAGLVFMRRDGTASWVWGDWDAKAVTLREFDTERIGDAIQPDIERPDNRDVWLRIVKDADDYIFKYKFDAREDWIDVIERPWELVDFPAYFAAGEYQIGLAVTGGEIATSVSFDYFDSPELGVLSIDPINDAATTWGRIKASP